MLLFYKQDSNALQNYTLGVPYFVLLSSPLIIIICFFSALFELYFASQAHLIYFLLLLLNESPTTVSHEDNSIE